MKFRGKRTAAFAMVATLALAACGSSSNTASSGADNGGGACKSGLSGSAIKIVQNAWTASAIEAQIMKQLIESQLCVPAEIVQIDENAQFTGLSDGTVDFVTELWPSGVAANEQAFIDDGSVVKMGELGTTGQIGWFVPDYVVKDHPTLATWEGFKDPAIAKLFATADTGSQGRFLGTDPSYSQLDAPLVKNLGLPFKVIFSGSEAATVAELDSAVSAHKPILMYWWTPTAAVSKYHLVQVKLPDYTAGCADKVDAVKCGYPADPLQKLASAKLQKKNPKVWNMLKKVTLTIDQQLAMLPKVEIDKQPAADVAKAWIDANKATWSTWFA